MSLNICTDLARQDHELIPFCRTVMGFANNLTHFGKFTNQGDNPNLNVVFKAVESHEFASLESPCLQSYESETDTLRIELSLSQQMCCSKHANCYVVAAMQEAVDVASDFFEHEHIHFEKEIYLNLINTISACHHKKLH